MQRFTAERNDAKNVLKQWINSGNITRKSKADRIRKQSYSPKYHLSKGAQDAKVEMEWNP